MIIFSVIATVGRYFTLEAASIQHARMALVVHALPR